MELTGMDTFQRLLPLAESASTLFEEHRLDEARRVGEEFWKQVPRPGVTDGEHLASQLSIDVARSAVRGGYPADARTWVARARDAYGPDSSGGYQCDFVEGTILFAEGRLAEARSFFARAVEMAGPTVFTQEDPRYKDLYHGTAANAPAGATAEELSEKGEQLCEADRFEEAIAVWRQAIAVADPADTDTHLWLNASIGDAQFQLGLHREAYDSMQEALKSGGNANPFVWLRLGQAAYELGETKRATDALLSAYMLEGDRIFEEEDPRYRQSLADQGLIS